MSIKIRLEILNNEEIKIKTEELYLHKPPC